ncbi:MAG: FliH/SctL family protein [Gammaproteobacteria bacterium]|jgi:flagellar assembly protein FliH
MSEVASIRSWQAPVIAGPGAERLDQAAIEAIKKAAYDEGFAAGERDGRAEGLRQTQSGADGFIRLLAGIDQPLAQMDEQIALQLAELASVVAAEMTRGLIRLEPSELTQMIQQLAETLPSDQHPPKLFLHPEDHALVAPYIEALADGHPLKAWPLYEEPSLEPGESRIQGTHSAIQTALIEQARALAVAAIRGRDATVSD